MLVLLMMPRLNEIDNVSLQSGQLFFTQGTNGAISKRVVDFDGELDFRHIDRRKCPHRPSLCAHVHQHAGHINAT